MRKNASKGGAKGKADGVVKGYALNPELAVLAGRKGGSVTGDRYKRRNKK